MPAPKKSKIELYVISKAKEKREAIGMSQSDLAFKLDVSLGFVGQVESLSHKSKYNLNHISKLATIFGCSPKEFLPDETL